MPRSTLSPAVMAIMLSLMLAGCGKRDEDSTAGDRPDALVAVQIGSVSPLTGPQAHLGKDNENGTRLAFEEINAALPEIGGRKIRFEVLSEDDQADPRNATIVAQKLVDSGVKAVIGHLNSGTSIPASKIYHDHGVVQITPSATAIAYTAQGFKTAFRVMTNDRQQGRVMGEVAVKRLGGKRVALIDDRTAYGQGLADEVEKAVKGAGGEIVTREYTTDRSTDFTAILTSVKAKKPDVLVYAGMDAQGAPMVRQMRRLGLKAQFLTGDGAQTTEFLKLAAGDAEGVLATSPGLPLGDMPGGKVFAEKFEARHGKIQNYAPYAYDAAMTLFEAMKRADSTDSMAVMAAMRGIDRQGVTGRVKFDPNGDIEGGAITLYRVRNGAWERVETVTSAAP